MNSSVPWVEKYRPKTLNDVKGQDGSISKIKELIKNGEMPHLIFEGVAGTGKTSTALAIVNDIFRGLPKDVKKESFKELNASDARGINVVRTMIKDFAKALKNGAVPFKIIILDEADNMTAPAQQALRRTIEKYSKNCRFIIICNYRNKIIPPVQSRCASFHFSPLPKDEMIKRLNHIITEENLTVSEAAINAIAYVSVGDARKAINILHGSSMISDKIDDKDVYSITGTVDRIEIRKIIDLAIEGSLDAALDDVENLLNSGASGKEIANQIFRETLSSELSNEDKILISALVSDAIYRITRGCSEKIQLNGIVAGIFSGRLDL